MSLYPTTTGARAVDVSRGGHSTLLNREWLERPDDERFLSLDALYDHVRARASASQEAVLPLGALTVNGGDETIRLETSDRSMAFSHWSFAQLCRLVGAPADYLRALPVELSQRCLNEGLGMRRHRDVQLYFDDDQALAVTGPKYGRIYDRDVVAAVGRMVASSDVAWKVPGVMNWSTGCYDPDAAVTTDSTTLFASDRDVALFLCDDQMPIEVGQLASGEPDLMFRGFFVKNSEVGDGALYVATMYLRGVCANRCLWGVEGFKDIRIRHTNRAPDRFVDEVCPVLDSYTSGDPARVVAGVNSAKSQRVITTAPRDDREQAREEQLAFLTKVLKFPLQTAEAILAHDAPGTNRDELVTVWDFTNQLTSYAQTAKHHDRRLAIEAKAGALLERATAAA